MRHDVVELTVMCVEVEIETTKISHHFNPLIYFG